VALFVGGFLILNAAPFLILPVIRLLALAMRRVLPAGGRLAADSLLSNPLRTAATAVALTIALSVVVVNSSLSASFVGTVQDQVDKAFARDFTVQAQGFTIEQGGGPGVPRSVQSAIEAMPETETVAPVRAMPLELPGVKSGSEQGVAIGVDPARQPKVDGTEFRGISQSRAYAGLERGGVLLGRAYARKAGLERGDTLALVGSAGRRQAEVVGVIDAIGAMAGMEMRLSLDTMKRIYGDHQPAELAVEARTADARAGLETKIAALLDRSYPNLEMQSAADRDLPRGQHVHVGARPEQPVKRGWGVAVVQPHRNLRHVSERQNSHSQSRGSAATAASSLNPRRASSSRPSSHSSSGVKQRR
jgi:hypothetical protein